LSYTLAQPLPPDDFLKQSLEKLCQATGADIGLIYILDLDEKALILRSFSGIKSNDVIRRITAVKYSKAEFLKVPRWKLADMSLADIFGESTLFNIAKEMRDEQVQSICASAFREEAGRWVLQYWPAVNNNNSDKPTTLSSELLLHRLDWSWKISLFWLRLKTWRQ
jgi:hypothetical protein